MAIVEHNTIVRAKLGLNMVLAYTNGSKLDENRSGVKAAVLILHKKATVIFLLSDFIYIIELYRIYLVLA